MKCAMESVFVNTYRMQWKFEQIFQLDSLLFGMKTNGRGHAVA